jgi:hypothetical protein
MRELTNNELVVEELKQVTGGLHRPPQYPTMPPSTIYRPRPPLQGGLIPRSGLSPLFKGVAW